MMASQDILLSMLDKIQKHQRSKDTLLTFYIEQRLNKSISNYYSQLSESLNVLKHCDEKTVIKKLVKKD